MANKSCALCGYEPKADNKAASVVAPIAITGTADRCPKCGGASWREFISRKEILRREGLEAEAARKRDPWGLT